LLGTSLAIDLKNLNHRVTGCVRSQKNLEILNSLPFDGVCLNQDKQLEIYLAQADGIIIGTPVEHIPEILQKIAQVKLKREAWVTDMASTKSDLMNWVEANTPNLSFIGSHPMAGSDFAGPQNAFAQLFENATIYVTKSQKMEQTIGEEKYQSDLQQIIKFWRDVHGKPFEISYQQHDKWAAYLSHGLHLVSCMVSHLLKDIPEVFGMQSVPAGGSFRDITRVAGSNPQLWDGIISSNRKEVLGYLKQLENLTRDWRIAFEDGTMSVNKIFSEAADIRKKIMK